MTHERDGGEVVVESFTDTAAEVSAVIDDRDGVVVDTALGQERILDWPPPP